MQAPSRSRTLPGIWRRYCNAVARRAEPAGVFRHGQARESATSQPAQGNQPTVCMHGVQDGQAERPANSVDNRSIFLLFSLVRRLVVYLFFSVCLIFEFVQERDFPFSSPLARSKGNLDRWSRIERISF